MFMIGKLPICLCEVSTLYCNRQNYYWYLFIYIPSTLCKMKSTCTHWTLAIALVVETRVHDFGWNDSISHAQCQVLIHNVPVLVLRCLKVSNWTWVSYCWTFINQINICGDCWSRHNSLYETVWASRPHFPEFLLSSIYLWSWQVAVSRDGEAKYIAIINYLVMPLHLSCHPNIDKQD